MTITSSDAKRPPGTAESRINGEDHTVLLSFASQAETSEWLSLLKSLGVPTRTNRRHRRLVIRVLDLQERDDTALSSRREEDRSSRHDSLEGTGRESAVSRNRDKGVRPGWALREKLSVEL
jgi:hypothetical protein